MDEFDRLGESQLWKASFHLARVLQPVLGAEASVMQSVARELPLIAGQAIFANSAFDRKIYLEELLHRMRQIESTLYAYDGGQPLLRVWFRLDKLRVAAFMEHDKVADETAPELCFAQCA